MQNDSPLHQEINQYRNSITLHWKKWANKRRISIIAAGLTGFLAVWLVLFLIEQTAYLSPLLKSSLWFTALACSAILVVSVRKSLRKLDRRSFYTAATRNSGLDALRHLIDLSENPREAGALLLEPALRQNLERLTPGQVNGVFETWVKESEAYRKYNRFGAGFVMLAVIIAGLAFFDAHTFYRSTAFWAEFQKPNPYEFTISPGNRTVEQGSAQNFSISFTNGVPNRVALALRTGVEERHRVIPLQETTGGMFSSGPIEVYSDTDYHFQMDGFISDGYLIGVSQLPRFRELIVDVTPPSYTGLESTRYTYPFSRIEAPEGSEIKLRGIANKALETVTLFRSVEDDIHPENSGLDWEASFIATAPDTLRFELLDEGGMSNRNPFNFTMAVVKDQHPTVRITAPEAVKQMLNPVSTVVRYEARDDYGFSSVFLRYEISEAFGGARRTGSVRLSGSAPAFIQGSHEWDLSGLGLMPADELVYWIEVNDNDAFNGFKQAVSSRHVIRAASLAEYLLDQEKKEDDIDRKLEDLARQNEDSRRELEQLRDDIIQNPDQNWEQQRQAEQLKEQHEEMAEQLNQLLDEFDDLRNELSDQNILSDETLQKYQELQDLLSEIDDPEILELLEKLRQGLENMDQQTLRDAMRDLEFSEQNYRERLERTLELFKQLRLNAEFDKMGALIEEMQAQEERILGMDDLEEQIALQEKVREQLQELEERLKSTPEKSPDRRQEFIEDFVDGMEPQLNELSEMLDQNLDEMKSGSPDPSQSRQQQEDIVQKMEDIKQQMQSAQSQMNMQQMNVNIFALQSILQTLLLLSEAQEELNLNTLKLEPNSLAFIDHARIQYLISTNFKQVVDSLYAVAIEVPSFPNLIIRERLEVQRSLDQSVEHLTERNKNRATTAERIALGGINRLSGMVADLLEQLMNNSGGGGGGGMSAQQMMEQMQDMSGQQQQLNQQIQDMINDMVGERLTQDQIDRLNQMAQQQNEIRRQLREMQQQGGLRSGDQLLSELERLAEQMEDAINDLRGGSLDRLLVERQQNILSRMLEAERAMDKREEDDQREGTTPEEFERIRPPEMTLEELEQEIRRRLQDPGQTKFTEDYQRLIRLYFQMLQDLENNAVEIR